MPTGHQVMQRPQPTQPLVPNWSTQVANLWVSHCRYRSRGRARKLPPATLANPGLKQLSQIRVMTAWSPTRFVVCERVVQKQVGQASVQLPHVMQRSATCAQRGWSSWAMRRSWQAVGRDRVADAGAHRCDRGRGAVLLGRGRRRSGSRSRIACPSGVPLSMRKPASISVRSRSYPPVTSGPVPIEVQKQVVAAVVHWTATTSTCARRAW